MTTQRKDAQHAANHWFGSDEGSAVYDIFQAQFLTVTREIYLEAALHLLGRVPTRILDVGCGSGEGLSYLAKRCPSAELYGIDPQLPMIAKARERIGMRSHLQQVDLLNFDAAATSFDLIVSYSSFRFWRQPARCLQRISSLTVAGGLAYIADLHRDTQSEIRQDLLAHMSGDSERSFLASQLDSAYSIAQLSEILAQAQLPPQVMQIGGFAGYAPNSREMFALLQSNEHLAEKIFSLHRSGFRNDRGHESVFYLAIFQ